jgi:hypothetical protein
MMGQYQQLRVLLVQVVAVAVEMAQVKTAALVS